MTVTLTAAGVASAPVGIGGDSGVEELRLCLA